MSAAARERVLVTGGSGLVGRCLQDEVARRKRRGGELASKEDYLLSRDVDEWEFIFLSSRDGDLTNYEEARKLFVKFQPTYVIHLAAKVGGLFANMADREGLFYKLNTQLNENVLKLSFDFQVKRCLSCLSTCIFPAQVDYPLNETKIHLGPPHESNYGYAMAKRQVDLMNKQYNQQRGSPVFFSIIPTNIYGPHDNFCPHDSHIVPGLIQRAHKAAMEASTAAAAAAYKASEKNQLSESTDSDCCDVVDLIVCGSGKPLRQFIYAPDVARLILWCMTSFVSAETAGMLKWRANLAEEPSIIFCPDESDEVSTGQVAEMIAKQFSKTFKIKMRVQYNANSTANNNSDGQFKKTASNEKLRRLLPSSCFEFTPLERGLEQTIDWFCSHYPQVRGIECAANNNEG